jgi:TetR/AcrR family transcriptional repressor of nem operon
MRVSKAQQDKNRASIVLAAAQLMRKRGIAGIGIDALAKAAGVTHGAIYSHFSDKDDLAAAAISHSLAQTSAQWHEVACAAGPPGSPEHFNELVRQYVSRSHRDNPGQGCAVAALAGDGARHGRKVRHAMSGHIEALAENMTAALDGPGDEAHRETAITAMAAMVGAVVLARAVDNPALSDRILLAVRRGLKQPARD